MRNKNLEIFDYITARCISENVVMGFTNDEFKRMLLQAGRIFGCKCDEYGNVISDSQNQEFFKKWKPVKDL